ncbi:MAG: hypothetical protein ACE5EC_01035 [Phycisphaerae bacterium]
MSNRIPASHTITHFAMVAIIAMALAVQPAVARADANRDFQKIIDNASPALVTVKFVLKVQGRGGNQEIEREFTGLMIEPTGLVLCSSIQLGTSKLLRSRLGGATPTDIKILIGDDTEGVEARLLGTDAELDISWVEIKKPEKAGYSYLDLAKAKTVAPGDTLMTISRMGKFFDWAVKVSEGRVGGLTKKPRKLIIPTDDLGITPGMPIFAVGGATVGIVVMQSPDPEDMDAGARMAGRTTEALILPVAEVLKATTRAKASAKSDEEEEDEEEESEKPAATKAVKKETKPADDEEEEEEDDG